jgi:putative radical SAM enzyme (TIGR03279 family)
MPRTRAPAAPGSPPDAVNPLNPASPPDAVNPPHPASPPDAVEPPHPASPLDAVSPANRASAVHPAKAAKLANRALAAPAGVVVQAVEADSVLDRLGMRGGDRILAIDGLVPRDIIDVQVELPAARSVVLQRDDQRLELRPDAGQLDPGALTLVEAVPGGIRECNNHCEFCFIRGLPSGLRPSLYVFDDDYRYSFLWGNFLTLTNLDEADWARIGYQRLSPLNVSVHATDVDVRRALLNNRHAPPILPQLERLARLGIQVNAQVVLCAGINDGAILDRTVDELASLYPGVASVSIVPVGLTRYSRVKHIRRPSLAEAAAALEQCERQQTRLRARLGVGFVYASDELYVLAGRETVPPAAAYDGFPVLTNGVGLLRSMLDDWQRLLDRPPATRTRARQPHRSTPSAAGLSAAGASTASLSAAGRSAAGASTASLIAAGRTAASTSAAEPSAAGASAGAFSVAGGSAAGGSAVGLAGGSPSVVWLTGRLAAPALRHMAAAWHAFAGWQPLVVVVDNAYFGQDVTASGLLSGADLIRALRQLPADVDDVVLPAGPFGFDGRTTLDGLSATDVGAAHPARVHLASSPRELLAVLKAIQV